MNIQKLISVFLISLTLFSCKEDPVQEPDTFSLLQVQVNDQQGGYSFANVNSTPDIWLKFSAPVDSSTISKGILFNSSFTNLPFTYLLENNDSTVKIVPADPLKSFTKYNIYILKDLYSKDHSQINSEYNITLATSFDTTDKFPRITDAELLTLIQQKTFTYFWDFGHPVSGMARERDNSGDLVTSGGTGFGVMSILVGIQRNFITRSQGLERLLTMVDFLQTKAVSYHGAFPHWLNGNTGATISFSSNDNGADLVETSYLMQGLLTARQFFNSTSDPLEIELRNKINTLWQAVEWDWFRKNNENVLYWHWSPTTGFSMNMRIQGWNEALIVYVLAASSPTHTIDKIVYDNGWALNGGMKNNKKFYGITLPLGPDYGGPLFFSQYSFLGIDPRNLVDQYANYWQQNVNHSLINYNYCIDNPKAYAGYSSNCWGLTACDIPNGYTACSPTNDRGIIAPTAAISALAFTPDESMQAIRFFYYKLGNETWGKYGFIDSFSLSIPWFADSFLAIDQGPQICMIENYRSGMLWDLFMSAPEVQNGLTKLGFSYK